MSRPPFPGALGAGMAAQPYIPQSVIEEQQRQAQLQYMLNICLNVVAHIKPGDMKGDGEEELRALAVDRLTTYLKGCQLQNTEAEPQATLIG